jgi:hypothetical protein
MMMDLYLLIPFLEQFYTFEKLQDKGYKIGVVNLPTYQRME